MEVVMHGFKAFYSTLVYKEQYMEHIFALWSLLDHLMRIISIVNLRGVMLFVKHTLLMIECIL